MADFPLVATLKQGCVVLNSDMSYSDHKRNGNTSVLKQNNTDVYTKTIKQLNKVEDITVKYENISDYVKAHETLHEAHTELNKENGVEIKPLGLLSQNQLRKLRKAVENMTATVLFNYDYQKKPWENENYLSFVTLTLPYKQMHTDAVLRKSLIAFIDNLRKTYGVKHYIWKAEAQKNGNIHFHLLLDKYIDYNQIQSLWNRQLSKFGYIDKYAEKRKKEGFIYKEFYWKKGKKIKSKKSYLEQKATYEAELLEDFQNPNTTDIKSLKNIQDTSRYIMKYMDKQEADKRPILGKIFGMSNETKQLHYPRIDEYHPLFNQVIHMISNNDFKVVLKDDFFSVHAGKVHDVVKKRYYKLWGEIKKHYRTIVNAVVAPVNKIVKEVELIQQTVIKPIAQPPQLELKFGEYSHGRFW